MYYGDYYRGDYYRGDPGLFGFLGGAIKKVGGFALDVAGTVAPGPIGVGARLARRALGGTRTVAPPPPTIVPRPSPFGTTASRRAAMAKQVPVVDELGQVAYELPRKRSRRMNYGNVKALRRADRRMSGFVKTARSALKHTNYKVVSKSAGTRGGSRGVITRREAGRALRA